MPKKLFLRVLPVAGLILLLGLGFAMVGDRGSLPEAQELAQLELWPHVHKELTGYLWWRPRDAEARLLMAEALVKDETLPGEEAVQRALEHLGRIPDAPPHGAAARTAEGRIELLLQLKPARARRSLRRAIELDPDAAEAYYLLWKLMDLIGRSDLAEPLFWRVYELTPQEGRAVRLREWYMSQFYPVTANNALERMMGLLGENQPPTAKTEANRYIQFRNAEPDEALSHAALARWFIREGDHKFALKLLDEAVEKVHNQRQDPFDLATRIEAMIALGEFDQADACFDGWPEPHDGYEYWKWRAIVLDEVRGQFDQALDAYDLALSVWPGAADWRTRFRRAACLAHAGDHRAAEADRAAADAVEKLMQEDVQKRVRDALKNLRNPAELEVVVDFYEKLGRLREAACWRSEIKRLQAR